jgi:ABC-type multidrug transport system fused ATPase/permease subunit
MINSLRLLWVLLEGKKVKLFVCVLLALLSGFLEVLGIGLIIPIISGAFKIGSGSLLGVPFFDKTVSIEYLCAGLLFILMVKLILIGFLGKYQSRFAAKFSASLSEELFCEYTKMPWANFCRRDSGEMIQNILNETSHVAVYGLSELINLIREIILLLLLVIAGLLIAVQATLASLLIVAAAFAVVRGIVVWKTETLGQMRQEAEVGRISHIKQWMRGMRELVVFGMRGKVVGELERHNNKLVENAVRQSLWRKMMRPTLEVFVFCGFVILCGIGFFGSDFRGASLLACALFGVRAIPCVSALLGASHGLRYGAPAIKKVHNELGCSKNKENGDGRIDWNPRCLVVDNLSFGYGKEGKKIFKELNLKLEIGCSYAIVGPSGSGKSTLVDLLLGLLVPEKGEIRVDEVNIHSDVEGWRKSIGYVPQQVTLLNDTLRNNITVGRQDSDFVKKEYDDILSEAALSDLTRDLPEGDSSSIGDDGMLLSGGERQRVGIARAFYIQPKVLILDEAMSAIDERAEAQILVSLAKKKSEITTILVTHRLKTAQTFDCVIELSPGLSGAQVKVTSQGKLG